MKNSLSKFYFILAALLMLDFSYGQEVDETCHYKNSSDETEKTVSNYLTCATETGKAFCKCLLGDIENYKIDTADSEKINEYLGSEILKSLNLSNETAEKKTPADLYEQYCNQSTNNKNKICELLQKNSEGKVTFKSEKFTPAEFTKNFPLIKDLPREGKINEEMRAIFEGRNNIGIDLYPGSIADLQSCRKLAETEDLSRIQLSRDKKNESENALGQHDEPAVNTDIGDLEESAVKSEISESDLNVNPLNENQSAGSEVVLNDLNKQFELGIIKEINARKSLKKDKNLSEKEIFDLVTNNTSSILSNVSTDQTGTYVDINGQKIYDFLGFSVRDLASGNFQGRSISSKSTSKPPEITNTNSVSTPVKSDGSSNTGQSTSVDFKNVPETAESSTDSLKGEEVARNESTEGAAPEKEEQVAVNSNNNLEENPEKPIAGNNSLSASSANNEDNENNNEINSNNVAQSGETGSGNNERTLFRIDNGGNNNKIKKSVVSNKDKELNNIFNEFSKLTKKLEGGESLSAEEKSRLRILAQSILGNDDEESSDGIKEAREALAALDKKIENNSSSNARNGTSFSNQFNLGVPPSNVTRQSLSAAPSSIGSPQIANPGQGSSVNPTVYLPLSNPTNSTNGTNTALDIKNGLTPSPEVGNDSEGVNRKTLLRERVASNPAGSKLEESKTLKVAAGTEEKGEKPLEGLEEPIISDVEKEILAGNFDLLDSIKSKKLSNTEATSSEPLQCSSSNTKFKIFPYFEKSKIDFRLLLSDKELPKSYKSSYENMLSEIKKDHGITESCLSSLVRKKIIAEVSSLRKKEIHKQKFKYANLLDEFNNGKKPLSPELFILNNDPGQRI